MHQNRLLVLILIVFSSVISFVVSSCGPKWDVNGKRIIAYVNDENISYAEFDSAVKDRRLKPTTPEQDSIQKYEVLNSMIEQALIDQKVDSVYEALSANPGFQKKKREFLEKPLLKLLYQQEISSKVDVTDEEAEQYYQENIDRYTTPEQVRASHILIIPDIDSSRIDDEKYVARKKREAEKEAEKLLKRVNKGEDFAELAKEYSEDPGSAKRGGDLGFFSRGRMVKPFEYAAFSMEIGEIRGPINTEFGYHIIKVTDKKDEEVKPYDEARANQIKQTEKARKERDMAQAYVDSVKESADYIFHDELIANDEDTTWKDDDWVAIINGVDTIFYEQYRDQKPKYLRFKNLSEDEVEREHKLDMLKTLAVNDILLHIAYNKGFDQDSMMVEQGEQFTQTQAKNRVEDFMRARDYEPSDSAMQSYFDEHLNEFVVEKPLHVYHIIFTDEEMAQAIYDSIEAGADFVEMAKKYYPGEPEIREVAYDLDFISDKEMPKPFWDAANSLQVGQVSPPVKTDWGWHVIKLVSRKHSRTFEQVKNTIKRKLQKEADEKAREEYLDEIRAAADIKINEPLLEQYRITNYSEESALEMQRDES
ncbi:MAG: hypothetical protein GF307_03040 [candidate division Zixibacteria bacterium]|nr:hypothetical protein [candidate division Zixibacteria bacterium]